MFLDCKEEDHTLSSTNRFVSALSAVGVLFAVLLPGKGWAQDSLPTEWISLPYNVPQPQVLACSPTGAVVAVGGGEGSPPLEGINLTTGRGYITPKVQSLIVRSAAFSGDGKYLANGGNLQNGSIYEVWDAVTGAPIWSVSGALDVEAVAFSGDGKTFAAKLGTSTSNAITVDVRQSANGKSISSFTNQLGGGFNTLALSPDGKLVATVGRDSNSGLGVLELRTTSNGKLAASIPAASTMGLTSVTFTHDGKHVVIGGYTTSSGSTLGRLQIWDTSTYKLTQSIDPNMTDAVSSVAASGDGKTLVVASNKIIEIWSASSNGKYSLSNLISDPILLSVAISADSKAVVDLLSNGNIETWSISDGTLINTIPPLTVPPVYSLAFSPDGKKLVVSDPSLSAYSTTTGGLITAPYVNSGSVNFSSVGFLLDGLTIADGGRVGSSGFLELRNWKTGLLTGTFNTAATSGVSMLAVSRDSKTLADGGVYTSSDNKTHGVLELWNPKSGALTASLPTTLAADVACVSISPDGKTLAAGGKIDNGQSTHPVELELWDIASKKLTKAISVNSLTGFVNIAFRTYAVVGSVNVGLAR
jgi:WD40 repeat protein